MAENVGDAMTFLVWDPVTKKTHPTSSVRTAVSSKGGFKNLQKPHPDDPDFEDHVPEPVVTRSQT